MHLLFVCSENRLRSPTAARVFGALDGVEAASAGTNVTAGRCVSDELIDWADVVLVMEDTHRRRIAERFPDRLAAKPVAVLDIPDVFPFMSPKLVELLHERVPRHLDREFGDN